MSNQTSTLRIPPASRSPPFALAVKIHITGYFPPDSSFGVRQTDRMSAFPYPVSRLHPSADSSFQSPFCAALSCFCRFRSFILPFTFPGIPFFLKLLRHSAAPLCKHLVGNLSHLSAFPVSICPYPFPSRTAPGESELLTKGFLSEGWMIPIKP